MIILLGIEPKTSQALAKCSPTEFQPPVVDVDLSCSLRNTCLSVSVGDLFQDALWVRQSADAPDSYTAGDSESV